MPRACMFNRKKQRMLEHLLGGHVDDDKGRDIDPRATECLPQHVWVGVPNDSVRS